MSPAPDGLRFVQDLVNTALAHDRLAEPRAARDWLRGALDEWAAATGSTAPLITLRPEDLAAVREFRERLRARLRAEAANVERPGPAEPAGSDVTSDLKLIAGRMRYLPASGDARAIAELVAAETLLAQARGTWHHLKTCANPACGVCFYDTSPNRSRVWHDTKTCGNASNLRASRARRKTG
jgi:predicted RNA-binding Zn ribbon-like protein